MPGPPPPAEHLPGAGPSRGRPRATTLSPPAAAATTTPTTPPSRTRRSGASRSSPPSRCGRAASSTTPSSRSSATHDALPSPEEQEALVRSVVHSGMLGDWRESEAGSLRFRLFEHEYEIPVEQEDKRIAVNTVMRSLRELLPDARPCAEALEVGRSRWLALEDLVSFHVGRRGGLPPHGPGLPRPRRPGRDRGLEDGPRRGTLQRGAGGRLRPLRHREGLGGRPRGDLDRAQLPRDPEGDVRAASRRR